MFLTRAAACRTIGAALLTLGGAPPARAALVSGGPGVLDLVLARKNLSTFASALKAAGLEAELAGPGPFTLFAPVDEAFAQLGDAARAAFSGPTARDRLLGCIVRDEIALDLGGNDELEMNVRAASGRTLAVHGKDNRVTIDGVRVLSHDIRGRNGLLTTLAAVLPG